MPVEAMAAATGTATMEITVSKSELLRELTATQGVVERKTTIPILSSHLIIGRIKSDAHASESSFCYAIRQPTLIEGRKFAYSTGESRQEASNNRNYLLLCETRLGAVSGRIFPRNVADHLGSSTDDSGT